MTTDDLVDRLATCPVCGSDQREPPTAVWWGYTCGAEVVLHCGEELRQGAPCCEALPQALASLLSRSLPDREG